MSSAISQSLEFLVNCAQPFVPEVPFEFLEPHPSCIECPLVDGGRLAEMTAKFGAKTLLEAGITVEEDGQRRVNPALVEDDALQVLRDSDRAPFDIVTAKGCLSGGVALYQTWRDPDLQRAYDAGKTLFGVTELEHVAILRSLGLAAVLISGLERLDAESLRRLLLLFGGDEFHYFPGKCALPSELFRSPAPGEVSATSSILRTAEVQILPEFLRRDEPRLPDALTPVVRELARQEAALDIEWHISVRWPDKYDREEFLLLRDLRGPDLIRRFLLKDDSLYRLKAFLKGKGGVLTPPVPQPAPKLNAIPKRSAPPKTPTDFATASVQLAALENERCPNRDKILQMRARRERLLNRDVFGLLDRQALLCKDAVRRSQLVAMGDLARLTRQQAILVQKDLQEIARAGGHRNLEEIRRLDDYLKMIDRMKGLGAVLS